MFFENLQKGDKSVFRTTENTCPVETNTLQIKILILKNISISQIDHR